MGIEKKDIITPANALTTLGAILSIHGASHLHETSGVIEYGIGRMLDLADGYVARRTHTSKFGAGMDAVADKAAVAAGVIGALHYDSVPNSVLATIATVNVINAVANIYADRKQAEPRTSKAGKYYMFGYNASFGALALSSTLEHNLTLQTTGWGIFALTTPIALKASYDYVVNAVKIKKQQASRLANTTTDNTPH